MPPKITVIAPLPCFSFEDLQGARGSPALPKSQSCGGEQSTTVNYNHDGSAKKFPNIFSKKVERLWSFEKRDLTGCTFYHPVLLTQPRKIWRSPKKIFTESDLVPNANVAKIGLKRHTRWKYQPCRPSLHGRVIRVFWVSRVAKFHLWGPLVHYCCS